MQGVLTFAAAACMFGQHQHSRLCAGDSLLLWDPQGRCLSSEAQPSGVGKQYQLAGTQLVASFSDQFAPWRFASADLGSRMEDTLIRLPLRTEAAAQSSSLCKVRLQSADFEAWSRPLCEPHGAHPAACEEQSLWQRAAACARSAALRVTPLLEPAFPAACDAAWICWRHCCLQKNHESRESVRVCARTCVMQAAVTAEEADAAMEALMPVLGKSLLFMGHLSTLRFLRWSPDAPQPTLVTQASSAALDMPCNEQHFGTREACARAGGGTVHALHLVCCFEHRSPVLIIPRCRLTTARSIPRTACQWSRWSGDARRAC